MNSIAYESGVEDFNSFCKSFDVRDIIAAADAQGQAVGFEKEIYALAILRAVHNGDFGQNREMAQYAISALWTNGYSKGFNAESFNEIFQKHFAYW